MTVAMVWCVNVVCVSPLVTLCVCMFHTSTPMQLWLCIFLLTLSLSLFVSREITP